MALRVSVGNRVFEPSWLMTLGAVMLVGVFIFLGRWQWGRGVAKEALWLAFARGADAAHPLGCETPALDRLPRFAHVALEGRYDPARQFLLDNRSFNGRPGYEVLTPLLREDGEAVLVDRGWVPFTGDRRRLPEVAFAPPERITVRGRADELPASGLALGRASPGSGPWPKLTSFPEPSQLAQALGIPLARRIVLLDADEPFGYGRAWQPPGVPPDRHFSYAIQWWLFAALAAGLYVVLNLRKTQR